MNLTLFILVLFALQGICLYVGGKSTANLKSQKDYYLAGRNIGFFPLMMTFLATQVGGGLILGSAEEAYRFGWGVVLYPLGVSLGLALLGLGLGRKLATFQVSTVAQIFEVAYRSPFLKRVASLLSIVSLFMVLVAQIIASNKFMVSLGVESKIWFILFWGVVILYTSLGGLKAVVATDMIQALFFIGVFLAGFGYALYSTEMPVTELIAGGLNSSDFVSSIPKLSGWLLMPLLFMAIEQDMGQRCLAGSSAKTVSKATLWAAAGTFLVSLVPIYFGVLAKSSNLPIPEGGSVLMTAIQAINPPFNDLHQRCDFMCDHFYRRLLEMRSAPTISGFRFYEAESIRLSQIVSAAIAVAAIFFSFRFQSVISLLIQSYELSVSCLFVPIMFALFKRQGNALSALLAILFGGIGFLGFKWIEIPFSQEILNILLSLIGYYIGEIVSKKTMSLR